jgi:hypothetical protein
MPANRLHGALATLLAAAAAWFFFFEYVPPLKRVHFYGDIEGYHYPLYVYANRAVREGRIPQWDSTIYSGMSFVANPQAAVFYPPNWLVYWKNAKRDGVRFAWIEILLVLHFGIALVLAWMWLRSRFRSELAGVLGGAAFAFSGFPLNETQHLGMVCGYAWYPLGLWGIDDAVERGTWRPLWKTAVASALCFLAGYPTTWIAYCVIVVVYALARSGFFMFAKTSMALLYSILLVMVQLAPAYEAAQFKFRETIYGGGLPGGWFFYLQYVMPNYFDQSHQRPPATSEESYMYLGAAALIGVVAAFALRRWRETVPALAILFAAWVVIDDPGRGIARLSLYAPIVNESLRQWNFTGAITLALAYVAACGIAALTQWKGRSLHPLFVKGAVLLAGLWIARLWILWINEGVAFGQGWWSAAEVAVSACLLFALLLAHRSRLAVAALLVLVFTEYKVYGTSRRFNSLPGKVDAALSIDRRTGGSEFQGVDPPVYRQMLANADYRVVANDSPPATDFRYYDLPSPQGFDPFLTDAYRQVIERYTPFATNRTFNVDLKNDAMLEDLGVRYVLTVPNSETREQLKNDPRFRMLGRDVSYFHVFEYLNAKPAWRFPAGQANRGDWTPERRLIRVQSESGGEFELLEQWFPGWKAFIDGREVKIARAREVFQSVQVPPGTHMVEFRYQSESMRAGAAVSLVSLLGMIVLLVRTRQRAAG